MPPSAPRHFALIAIAFSSMVVASCRSEVTAASDTAVPSNTIAPSPAERAIVPAPEPRLDREALLIAAIRARSAAAVGSEDATQQAELDGKRFQFRMRLGCSLSAEQRVDGLRGRYDAEQRRVELDAAPDLLLGQPEAAALAGEAFEAVEGFWIPRPWLLASTCAGVDPAQQPSPEQPSIAIAQFYTNADPRTERREGRSYQARENFQDEPPSPGSWDLVLRGRLRALGGGEVIVCRSPTPGGMPVCIISVAFEEVTIENVGTGEVLARWGRG